MLKADSYLGERLRILDLSNNKIMNIGCETISESLKQNRTLQYLDLGYNKLEDRALYYVAEMLAHNQSLRFLSLLGNQFTGRSLYHLAKSLCANVVSRLQILKLGTITCSETEMYKFVNNGLVLTNLHLVYIVSNQGKIPSIKELNRFVDHQLSIIGSVTPKQDL